MLVFVLDQPTKRIDDLHGTRAAKTHPAIPKRVFGRILKIAEPRIAILIIGSNRLVHDGDANGRLTGNYCSQFAGHIPPHPTILLQEMVNAVQGAGFAKGAKLQFRIVDLVEPPGISQTENRRAAIVSSRQ